MHHPSSKLSGSRRHTGILATLRTPTILLTLALLATGCGLFKNDDSDAPPPTSMAPPPEVNIAYGPDPAQMLDIYRSPNDADKPVGDRDPRPVAVWIHGGGFTSGEKAGSLSEYFQPLLDDGWDIVAINYRLAQNGQNGFPTGILDSKQAVRWVKANAEQQGWDPNSVAAMGHSAGGSIAEMLAVSAGVPELEPTGLPPELEAVDSSIIGTMAMAPVSDMRLFGANALFTETVRQYLGCNGDCSDAALAKASVQTYVTKDSKPIMAIHGSKDPIAAPSQGQLVEEAYKKAGIGDRFKLIVVDDGPEDFQGHVPDMKRWMDDVVNFLDDARPDNA